MSDLPFEAVKSGVDAYHEYRRSVGLPAQLIGDGEVRAILSAALGVATGTEAALLAAQRNELLAENRRLREERVTEYQRGRTDMAAYAARVYNIALTENGQR